MDKEQEQEIREAINEYNEILKKTIGEDQIEVFEAFAKGEKPSSKTVKVIYLKED